MRRGLTNARCQPLQAVGSTLLLGGFPLTQARASHAEWAGWPIAPAVPAIIWRTIRLLEAS